MPLRPSRFIIQIVPLCSLLVAILGVALAVLAGPVSAEAQTANRLPKIGILANGTAQTDPLSAIEQGLRELGWVEGRTVVVERRFAQGATDRLPELAADLVRLKVDLIVASDPPATRAAVQATRTVPIVIRASADPTADGLVASLARPGGNVTGLYSLTDDLYAKRLELLKEAVPGVRRVAVLWDSEWKPGAAVWKGTEGAARVLGLRLQSLDMRGSDAFERAFKAAVGEHAGALIALRNPILMTHRQEMPVLALKYRLPSMYDDHAFVEAGGLLSYGADLPDLYRRMASYVDRILKGAKRGDLPVEQPTKFVLSLNRRTAREIGLALPPSIVARADRVIE